MKREKLDIYTDRAIRATEAGKLIPPIVYLPRMLRGHNVRLTVDNVRLTHEPPTVAENHVRIAEADPIGFLNALMHGQPIPAFEITPEGSIKVRYEIADLETRERVAKWLAARVTLHSKDKALTGDVAGGKDPANWDSIVARRVGEDDDKSDG